MRLRLWLLPGSLTTVAQLLLLSRFALMVLCPQVATDTRLWLYGQLKVIREALQELINVSCDRSAAEVDVLMPGFTHLQPAMTVRWGAPSAVCTPLLQGAKKNGLPALHHLNPVALKLL
jgi:argininosuccinate lyase